MRLLLLVSCVLACLGRTAFADGCSQAGALVPRPLSVQVTPVITEEPVGRLESAATLGHTLQEASGSRIDALATGLTRANLRVLIRVEPAVVALADGRLCATAQDIDADLIVKLAVQIAREIPERTCAYRAIMTHERKHVEASKTLAAESIPIIEAALRREAERIGTVRVAAPEAAAFLLRDLLLSGIRGTISGLYVEHAHRQRAIDSPEEYDRISGLCDGEERRLLDQAAGSEEAAFGDAVPSPLSRPFGSGR